MAEHCSSCGARIRTRGRYCPACGGEAGLLLPVRAGALEPAGLPWPLALLGPWPEGDRVLLHGMRGAGKSTLAFQSIRWALERGAPAVWASTEQTPEQVSRYALRCLGPELSAGLRLLDHPAPAGLLELISGGMVRGGVLVLDSLSGLADWREQALWVKRTQEAAAEGGARLVFVGQHNGAGGAAGEAAVPHDVDAVIAVLRESGSRMIAVEKNRNGPEGRAYFDLGPSGAEPPDLSGCAWSVEGEAGELRLEPYPASSKAAAKWDGLLRVLEQERDLRPGDASAARRADYLPSGYLEPRDVAERRTFAENHGLNWRMPTDGE